eukprot:1192430-Prorocentrum_minimum.AAC.2
METFFSSSIMALGFHSSGHIAKVWVLDVSTLWRHASPSTLYTHPTAAAAEAVGGGFRTCIWCGGFVGSEVDGRGVGHVEFRGGGGESGTARVNSPAPAGARAAI